MWSAAASAQNECIPVCREGYYCDESNGQCVSACNPACPYGTMCTDDGRCVAPPPPEEPDAQGDGGVTFAAGIDPTYTLMHYYGLQRDRFGAEVATPFTATSHMFTLMGSLEVEYGFSEHVYFGLRFGLGRIINSDDSTGAALQMVVGPTVLLRPARPFFIGLDLLLSLMSFDDLSADISGYPRGVDSSPVPELDGELLVSLDAGLRFGFIAEITPHIAFTVELRLHVAPGILAQTGADVFFSETGTGTVQYDMANAFSFSAGLFIGSRLFN